MQKLLAAIHLDEPASLKRFLVMLFGAAGVLLAPQAEKLGFTPPPAEDVAIFAGLVATYILQSSSKSKVEAKAAGEAAATARVPDTAAADAVLQAAIEEEKAK